MFLSSLCSHGPIAIQCHDAPDADALASGFALHAFFRSRGLSPYFFYGGRAPISKPNLRIMVEGLGIPVEHAPGLDTWDGLLVTVDCQHGSNNTQHVKATRVAVIDHHVPGGQLPELSVVKPQLGSCATLVWSLLQEEGFMVDRNLRPLSIALYYGLYTDTNAFSESRHPLDLNMRDALTFQDPQKVIQEEILLKTLFTSNLSLDDLSVAFTALHNIHVDAERQFALAGAAPCDQNLLGYISDLAIQVAGINTVIVWTPQGDGLKFSVRTSGRDIKARDVTAWLVAGGRGSGGGHREKAGGWLDMRGVAEQPLRYVQGLLEAYMGHYTVIRADTPREALLEGARLYGKKSVTIGFVPSSTLIPPGTRINLRMLEGETSLTADEDIYLMIGVQGEAYFTRKATFDKKYIPWEQPFAPETAFEYNPTVSVNATGETMQLMEHARQCVSKPDASLVLARRLSTAVKVFPEWDADNYLLGEAGDWLVMQKDNPVDAYVVKRDVFPLLYEAAPDA